MQLDPVKDRRRKNEERTEIFFHCKMIDCSAVFTGDWHWANNSLETNEQAGRFFVGSKNGKMHACQTRFFSVLYVWTSVCTCVCVCVCVCLWYDSMTWLCHIKRLCYSTRTEQRMNKTNSFKDWNCFKRSISRILINLCLFLTCKTKWLTNINV